MKGLKFFLFFSLFFLSQKVLAQMPEFQGIEKGVLQGRVLFMDTKAPMPSQAIVIIAYFDGNRILMLDKQTDANGRFEFQNIFR